MTGKRIGLSQFFGHILRLYVFSQDLSGICLREQPLEVPLRFHGVLQRESHGNIRLLWMREQILLIHRKLISFLLQHDSQIICDRAEVLFFLCLKDSALILIGRYTADGKVTTIRIRKMTPKRNSKPIRFFCIAVTLFLFAFSFSRCFLCLICETAILCILFFHGHNS